MEYLFFYENKIGLGYFISLNNHFKRYLGRILLLFLPDIFGTHSLVSIQCSAFSFVTQSLAAKRSTISLGYISPKEKVKPTQDMWGFTHRVYQHSLTLRWRTIRVITRKWTLGVS